MKVLRKHRRDAPTSKPKPLATLRAGPPFSSSSCQPVIVFSFVFDDDTFSAIEVSSFDRCTYAYTQGTPGSGKGYIGVQVFSTVCGSWCSCLMNISVTPSGSWEILLFVQEHGQRFCAFQPDALLFRMRSFIQANYFPVVTQRNENIFAGMNVRAT